MTEHIKIENAQDILTLTFARPDKKNALTNVMYGALADAIVAAETDRAARAIVIRGEGDVFTAGNDVGEFAAVATGAFQGERHVARFVQALARSTRPLVAAVQGRAVGIGTTMLLHLRFRPAGGKRAAVNAIRQPGAGAGGRLDPADADARRLCPCLRDVRARRNGRCEDRA